MSSAPSLGEFLKNREFDLSLGAGFFGFYAHIGFIKALEHKNLQPQMIYGASAGAIVGAFKANGYSAEEMQKIFCGISKNDFWDLGLGFGLLKGLKYHKLLTDHLPQNFEQLKTPLHISVFDVLSLKSKTLSSGNLALAVRGSSAFPGLFHPVKHQNTYLLDGGIADDLAIKKRQSSRALLVHAFGYTPIKSNSNRIVLNFKKIPRSGPNKMHMGQDIINMAFDLTTEALQKSL